MLCSYQLDQLGNTCKEIHDVFSKYNQQDATFLNLFTSIRHSKCFRWLFHPSLGAQNCTYSVRHLSDRYCYLLLKHVECLIETHKLRNAASCWLYSENILAMHGSMNVRMITIHTYCYHYTTNKTIFTTNIL